MVKLNYINKFVASITLVLLILIACKEEVDLGGKVPPSSIFIIGPDTVNLYAKAGYNVQAWTDENISYSWNSSDPNASISNQSSNVVEVEFKTTGDITLSVTVEGLNASKMIYVKDVETKLTSITSDKSVAKGGDRVAMVIISPFEVAGDAITVQVDTSKSRGAGLGSFDGSATSSFGLINLPDDALAFGEDLRKEIREFAYTEEGGLIEGMEKLIFLGYYEVSTDGAEGTIAFKTDAIATKDNSDVIEAATFENVIAVDNISPENNGVAAAKTDDQFGENSFIIAKGEFINHTITFSESVSPLNMLVSLQSNDGTEIARDTLIGEATGNTAEYEFPVTIDALKGNATDEADRIVFQQFGEGADVAGNDYELDLATFTYYRDRYAPVVNLNNYPLPATFFDNTNYESTGKLTFTFIDGNGASFADTAYLSGNSVEQTDVKVHYAVTVPGTFRIPPPEETDSVTLLNDTATVDYTRLADNSLVLTYGNFIADYNATDDISGSNSIETANIRFEFQGQPAEEIEIWFYVEDLAGNVSSIAKAGRFSLQ